MPSSTRSPRPLAIVADDNVLIRMDVADMLEDAGYTPVEAHHGDHALNMLLQYHPHVHVLFTDVEMPGGKRDGFALARETAANWPHVAIVVASGDRRPQASELPEGATFVAKPFNAEIVREHLRKVMAEEVQPDALKSGE